MDENVKEEIQETVGRPLAAAGEEETATVEEGAGEQMVSEENPPVNPADCQPPLGKGAEEVSEEVRESNALPYGEEQNKAENANPTTTGAVPLPLGKGGKDDVRDREAEWRELAEAHPEVVGKTLPDDIFRACMTSDRTPLQVYESMMLSHMQDELEKLRKENELLRQNADAAARAPVIGTAGGGVDNEPEDPFLRAFRAYK